VDFLGRGGDELCMAFYCQGPVIAMDWEKKGSSVNHWIGTGNFWKRHWIVFIFFCTGTGLGQSPDSFPLKTVQAVRINEPLSIDGRLDEAVWAGAAVVEDFHQVLPIEYAPPSQKTQFFLLYDDDALYVAGKMWDSEPDLITAKILRQGGQSWTDDQFHVLLDPFNNRRSGYRFMINPNGIRQEGLAINTSQVEWNWEGIWQAAAAQDEEGWVAEARIPFKSLSFDPEGDTWGINFTRKISRENETIAWVSRNQTFSPAIAGVLTGLEGAKQGLGLDIVPTLTVNKQRAFTSYVDDSSTEPSLDIFYKITSGLNAALTLNTDFSAAEVDDRQVNLTRFGLFFPEKRDFFLQDMDIFEFGHLGNRNFSSGFSRPLAENARPFFSRKIGLSSTGQPVGLEAGGKLSGRIGRWNVGALTVQQEQFKDIEAADLFVGRVTANVLQESSLGLIATNGDPRSNRSNSVLGVDFSYQNTRLTNGRAVEADLWYQQSDTEGIDGEDGAWGAKIRMPNNTGFKGELGVKEVQANFIPALGYINRRDIRDYTFEAGYTYRSRGSGIRSIYGGGAVQRVERLSGGLQSQVASLRLDIQNQTNDKIVFTYSEEKEGLVQPFEISRGIVISRGLYAFDEFRVHVDTGTHRKLKTRFTVGSGSFYAGEQDNVNFFMEWTPTQHLRTSVNYRYNDVSLPEGDFILRVVQAGLDFIFSSTLSWVNLLQYDNNSEMLGINSRLHWVPQAGREVFVVLNHNLEDPDRDNSFESAFADLSFKVNYTLRF